MDDSPELVEWMPAHTSESSIGSKYASDGRCVDELMWHSNQLADFLAKDATVEARAPAGDRSQFA